MATAATKIEPVQQCTWLALSPGSMSDAVVDRLMERHSRELIVGPVLPQGSSVGFVIADEAHLSVLEQAAECSAGALQTILITEDVSGKSQADFVLSTDVDSDSVLSVYRAAREYRNEVLNLRADVATRKSAIGTINYGQFVFSSLDEARALATMLAMACPNSDLVVVGLQELMVNAVEHGNLQISADEKQKLLMQGGWREEVERRLRHPDYRERIVVVSFQRSEHLISITIQDEGLGFDHQAFMDAEAPVEGYRGRGIAMARDLSFSSVTYLGVGNIVEATIMNDVVEV